MKVLYDIESQGLEYSRMIRLELSRQITYLMITVLDLELEVIFFDPSQLFQISPVVSTAESDFFSLDVSCSTADSTDVKVADPPVVSTAESDFLLLQLVHLSLSAPAAEIHLFIVPSSDLYCSSDSYYFITSTSSSDFSCYLFIRSLLLDISSSTIPDFSYSCS
ncbi:hypothetical protein F511_08950 [Dorcoceras hygrometricum]|uniref:Uncharacterized protein n=1 Tax=Dorcoceras hygrometricum TaxID=472368 RepID=A0A2Z7CY92_9LAMI|nr:hypothetical protein F511_08950 [Dorcoceras hygrometricum]